ncbi:hypothetical protein [Sulfurimonas sp.]|uniref:hypothetical protein n=1 Tax=Sulfurimonas sp. TaxID=2022749 RepID=UPI0025D684D4|nr:hypothetical protein [Sulfurimonas sp.]
MNNTNKTQEWEPTSEEWNYDARRLKKSYQHMNIVSSDFPNYKSIPKLINCHLVTVSICNKIRLIQKKLDIIITLHTKSIVINPLSHPFIDGPKNVMLPYASNPSLIHEYKLEIESMVYIMRRVLDSLVQLSYVVTNYNDIQESRIIAYNEIGRFSDLMNVKIEIDKIIIGNDIYKSDETKFLKTINHLFNSFKHSLIHDESYNQVCNETPSVVSYQAKQNNHNKTIIIHNHNIHHLVMGFQDTVLRIIDNQKLYILNN